VARSIYLAAAEARSGKAAIAVGLLDALTRRVGRVGIFRPVTRSADPADDHVVELLLHRLGSPLAPAEVCGVTYEQIHEDEAGAMSLVIERYHALAADCDAVLVVGSDYTDVVSPTEFSVNARIAANLGAPLLLVASAREHSPEQVHVAVSLAVEEARVQHARVIGIIANQVPEPRRSAFREALTGVVDGALVYAVPDSPVLAAPTVRDLVAAADGRLLHGDDSLLDRESGGLVIAAMTLPNVLERIFPDAVVISPADRADIILGLLLAHHSQTFPELSGIVLNGGFDVHPQVTRLVEGLKLRVPVVAVDEGTAETAAILSRVPGRITATATRKVQTALALVEEFVDCGEIVDRIEIAPSTAVTPLMFEHELLSRARAADRHIVLPEGEEDRILLAADQLLRRKVARLTLLGDPELIARKAASLRVDISGAAVLDPHDETLRRRFAQEYTDLRASKGMSYDIAWDTVVDVSFFGTMMVLDGLADGMVSGSVNTTAHTIRPALQVIRTVPGVSVVSSVFLMCLADRVLVYGDCAVNPDPTAEQLADIAISSAATAEQFGIEPRIAMLSYSTGQSGTGADVDKVRAATALVRERAPHLSVEGPIQYDAAVDLAVAATKLKDSPVAGRATVLIFPDLNTGNNTYKAVQRSAGAVAIGPVLQGLRMPVNDLSRGALVQDIVNTVAITAIQAAQPTGDPAVAAGTPGATDTAGSLR